MCGRMGKISARCSALRRKLASKLSFLFNTCQWALVRHCSSAWSLLLTCINSKSCGSVHESAQHCFATSGGLHVFNHTDDDEEPRGWREQWAQRSPVKDESADNGCLQALFWQRQGVLPATQLACSAGHSAVYPTLGVHCQTSTSVALQHCWRGHKIPAHRHHYQYALLLCTRCIRFLKG
jgi:hypothetical protein